MLAVLTLLAAPLAAAQGDALSLSGAHFTFGVLGPARADRQVLPGDSLFLTFDIENLATDPTGKAAYATELELTDASGKAVFRQPARDQEMLIALGGRRLPAFARLDVSPDQAAGEYTLKVTVTDKASKQSKALSEKFTILPKGFGLVGVSTSADPDGAVPAGLSGAGQILYVNGAVLQFARGPGGQPKVTLAMTITDESGKPTLPQPFSGVFDKDVPGNAVALPAQFAVALNRTGKFKVELKATDDVAKKTSVQTFEITVMPAR